MAAFLMFVSFLVIQLPTSTDAVSGLVAPLLDDAFNSSSIFGNACEARDVKLLGTAWCARTDNGGDWLQVDLGRDWVIDIISTKGRPNAGDNEYTTRYTLSYKPVKGSWANYHKNEVLDGNIDIDTIKHNPLSAQYIIARYLRLYPTAWNNWPSLRLEVYGHLPTDSPTSGPTPIPTTNPTPSPTDNPTHNPTHNPTKSPTKHPTLVPTKYPTSNPTNNPSLMPTNNPTYNPTSSPTNNPSPSPTQNPSLSPTNLPTNNPTTSPTNDPSSNPTHNPTTSPTNHPITTLSPTQNPSLSPTNKPTTDPTTNAPTKNPTQYPTSYPTNNPTKDPTNYPTSYPTHYPSGYPTSYPSNIPSLSPTNNPSYTPSSDPTTYNPTPSPTHEPSYYPSTNPTTMPTLSPTTDPTFDPSTDPTNDPTFNPSTPSPTSITDEPTINPTYDPSIDPTPSPILKIPVNQPTNNINTLSTTQTAQSTQESEGNNKNAEVNSANGGIGSVFMILFGVGIVGLLLVMCFICFLCMVVYKRKTKVAAADSVNIIASDYGKREQIASTSNMNYDIPSPSAKETFNSDGFDVIEMSPRSIDHDGNNGTKYSHECYDSDEDVLFTGDVTAGGTSTDNLNINYNKQKTHEFGGSIGDDDTVLAQSMILDDILDDMALGRFQQNMYKKSKQDIDVIDDIQNDGNLSESHDSDDDVILEINNQHVTAGGPISDVTQESNHDSDNDMSLLDGMETLR